MNAKRSKAWNILFLIVMMAATFFGALASPQPALAWFCTGTRVYDNGDGTYNVINSGGASWWRIVSETGIVVAEPQRQQNFYYIPFRPGNYGVEVADESQAQWLNTGCNFTISPKSISPTGTATCNGGKIKNSNSEPISVVYKVDGEEKFNGTVPANSTVDVIYQYADQSVHSAKLEWNGKTIDLGTFGPCAEYGNPTGTATCNGGKIKNSNSEPISVVYKVDGEEKFNGTVPANSTVDVIYQYADQSVHSAKLEWNGKTIDLGTFGPCAEYGNPTGTATCNGGKIKNSNSEPISVVYKVDGEEKFNGTVPANSTVDVIYQYADQSVHSAKLEWNGKTIDLGTFGPCAEYGNPTGTATCNGGKIKNSNSEPISVVYKVDGEEKFNGTVPANSTVDVIYQYADQSVHSAKLEWNGKTIDLGTFGPCAEYGNPTGTATCNGGKIKNSNSEPISVVYKVDGEEKFNGTVPANSTVDVIYQYADQSVHSAKLEWNGKTIDLGTFGPCGNPPPVEIQSRGICVFAQFAYHEIDGTVFFRGNGRGTDWRVVRSDGRIMAKGEGSKAFGYFKDNSGLLYHMEFKGEDGNWYGGKKCANLEVVCPTCIVPLWETVPRMDWVAKGPCTFDPTTWTECIDTHLEVTLLVPFRIQTTRSKLVTVGEPFMGYDGVTYYRLWFDFDYERDRDVMLQNMDGTPLDPENRPKKNIVCSLAPGMWNIQPDGVAHFELGNQVSDWAKFVFQMGLVSSYDDGLTWANALKNAGSLALPVLPK